MITSCIHFYKRLELKESRYMWRKPLSLKHVLSFVFFVLVSGCRKALLQLLWIFCLIGYQNKILCANSQSLCYCIIVPPATTLTKVCVEENCDSLFHSLSDWQDEYMQCKLKEESRNYKFIIYIWSHYGLILGMM